MSTDPDVTTANAIYDSEATTYARLTMHVFAAVRTELRRVPSLKPLQEWTDQELIDYVRALHPGTRKNPPPKRVKKTKTEKVKTVKTTRTVKPQKQPKPVIGPMQDAHVMAYHRATYERLMAAGDNDLAYSYVQALTEPY